MTFSKRLIAVWILCLPAASSAHGATQPGDVVFHTDSEAPDGLSGWQGAGRPGIRLQQRDPGSKCLCVERPADAGGGSNCIRIRLPLEKLRATRVLVEALVKAEGVAKPPTPR